MSKIGGAKPEIVCPVIRGMVHDGHLNVDKKGDAKISQLAGIFEDIGLSRNAAYVATAGNGLGDIFGNLFSGSFNVNELRGGLLDHSGDSMILREGKFDEERFDVLVSHSSDGKTMTAEDFTRAIATNKKDDDASWIGSKISGVEFKILLEGFGTEGPDGVKRLSIKDLRNLYEHKQVPPSFRPDSNPRAENNISSVAAQVRSLANGGQLGLANAGVKSAMQGEDLFSAGDVSQMGAGKGICPHMGSGGDQATAASAQEVMQLHNQVGVE
jgi:hypothetical protein